MANIIKPQGIIKNAVNFAAANKPEILAGMSLLGLGATAYLSFQAGIRVHAIYGEMTDFRKALIEEKPMEVAKILAKEFAPAVAATAFTGVCIVGSQVIAHRQYGALMAAYMMSNDKMKTFESKAVALLGEKPAEELRAEIAQERVLMNPVTSGSGMVIDTGEGNTLCYDAMSGRYFKSDVERVRRAQNDVNEQINGDWSATLNDFYSFLGLRTIQLGDDLGWNNNNLLKITFDSALTSSGEPVLVLDYEVYPEYRLL